MILDTNAFSAFLQNEEALLVHLHESERGPVLTVVTAAEYRFGALGSRHKQELLEVLDEILRTWEVLLPSVSTAKIYAELAVLLKRKGKPVPANDLWIAALAKEYDLPVLTRDRHFNEIDGIQTKHW